MNAKALPIQFITILMPFRILKSTKSYVHPNYRENTRRNLMATFWPFVRFTELYPFNLYILVKSFFRNKRPNAFDYQPRYKAAKRHTSGKRRIEEGFLREYRASSPTSNTRYKLHLKKSKEQGYKTLFAGVLVVGLIVLYFQQGHWIQERWGNNGQFLLLGLIFIAAIRFLRNSNA